MSMNITCFFDHAENISIEQSYHKDYFFTKYVIDCFKRTINTPYEWININKVTQATFLCSVINR